MKRLKKFALLLFTLLLVAAGAGMPLAASWLQDARQMDPEVRPFDSFSLTLRQEADLSRVFRALSSSYYYIKDDVWSEYAVLTGSLALETAENTLLELAGRGLIESALVNELLDPQIYPQEIIPVTVGASDKNAAIAGVPGPSADAVGRPEGEEGEPIPTWSIFWPYPSEFFIWLDDTSGKAFEFYIPYSTFPKQTDLYAYAEDWRQFVEDYYGVEARLAEEAAWYDSMTQFTIFFPLGEDGETYHLNLNLYSGGPVRLTPYD